MHSLSLAKLAIEAHGGIVNADPEVQRLPVSRLPIETVALLFSPLLTLGVTPVISHRAAGDGSVYRHGEMGRDPATGPEPRDQQAAGVPGVPPALADSPQNPGGGRTPGLPASNAARQAHAGAVPADHPRPSGV